MGKCLMWIADHAAHLTAIAGLALVVAGVACYSWPAGLIVAGIGLLADAVHGLRNKRTEPDDY